MDRTEWEDERQAIIFISDMRWKNGKLSEEVDVSPAAQYLVYAKRHRERLEVHFERVRRRKREIERKSERPLTILKHSGISIIQAENIRGTQGGPFALFRENKRK